MVIHDFVCMGIRYLNALLTLFVSQKETQTAQAT